MENSNLITLLRSFTKKEMSEFDKFLRSPYFTEGKGLRHKIIYQYFSMLREFYPGFDSGGCTKEKIFSLLYPKTKYNDGIMRKLNSDLMKLGEKFLIQLELENDEYKQGQYLINNLSPRKLDKIFMKKAQECYDYIDTARFDLHYFLNKHSIDIVVNNFYVYRQDLLHKYDFQKSSDSFFLHFLSKSLEIYRSMAIDETLFKIKFKKHFMNEVLAYLKNNPKVLEENHLIQIHYYELMVNIRSDKNDYLSLRKLKDSYADKMDVYGRYNIYINLSAFCYKMIRGGDAEYRKEQLKIDIEMLEKDVHGFTDYVSYLNYHSIIRNAAILKEFAWAEKFKDAYIGKLDPVHKEFAVNYSSADICFEKREFDKALEHLSKISIEYDYEKQRIKNMVLKIYYETNSFENAYSAIASNRNFLRNDRQMPDSRKNSYIEFLKYAKQVLDIKVNYDEIKARQLQQKIQNTEFFINKDWLLEKTAELLGRTKAAAKS